MTTKVKQDSIFLNGVLFDLDCFWWKGFTVLQAQDLDKAVDDIPEFMKLGRKRLLNDSDFRDFQAIDTRARTLVDLYSYPFMLSQLRFVPFTVLPKLIDDLEALKKFFNASVSLFIVNYEDAKTSFLNKYDGYRDRLVSHYPSIQDLQYKFSFSWSLFEMTIPRDIKAVLIEADQMKQVQLSWQSNQQEVQQKLEGWVDDIGRLMRKELITVCQNIQANIVDGKIIRTPSLDKARSTIQRLKQMNFLDDKEVEQALNSVERTLPGEFDRDVPSIMAGLSRTLEVVSKNLTESDINKVTKEFKRKFILKKGI